MARPRNALVDGEPIDRPVRWASLSATTMVAQPTAGPLHGASRWGSLGCSDAAHSYFLVRTSLTTHAGAVSRRQQTMRHVQSKSADQPAARLAAASSRCLSACGGMPIRTTVHSPPRSVAIHEASGSETRLRSTSAFASSCVMDTKDSPECVLTTQARRGPRRLRSPVRVRESQWPARVRLSITDRDNVSASRTSSSAAAGVSVQETVTATTPAPQRWPAALAAGANQQSAAGRVRGCSRSRAAVSGARIPSADAAGSSPKRQYADPAASACYSRKTGVTRLRECPLSAAALARMASETHRA